MSVPRWTLAPLSGTLHPGVNRPSVPGDAHPWGGWGPQIGEVPAWRCPGQLGAEDVRSVPAVMCADRVGANLEGFRSCNVKRVSQDKRPRGPRVRLLGSRHKRSYENLLCFGGSILRWIPENLQYTGLLLDTLREYISEDISYSSFVGERTHKEYKNLMTHDFDSPEVRPAKRALKLDAICAL